MSKYFRLFVVAPWVAVASARANFSLTTLASFTADSNGGPQAGLVIDGRGDLFGTTVGGGADFAGTVFELPAGSHTPTTLATFDGGNGQAPGSNLIMDNQGNLYGTTQRTAPSPNGGTVFKVNGVTHQLTVLAQLTGESEADVVMDGQGDLLGTEVDDGGEVFEIAGGSNALSTAAQLTTAGSLPQSGLLPDGKGNFFGTTSAGGPNPTQQFGAIYKLTGPSHALSIQAVFDGTGGKHPVGDLVADNKGDLFGVTSFGGTDDLGTIFELPAGASTVTTLVSFDGDNGSMPEAGLLIDGNGDLFGTTSEGGGPADDGTVFELAAGTDAVSTLVAFDGADGAAPFGSLIADNNGNLFGTTLDGGPSGQDGTMFELSPTAVPEPASAGVLVAAMSLFLEQRRLRLRRRRVAPSRQSLAAES
jgi:uncharacterized repeat protein (TIGR03803 family)